MNFFLAVIMSHGTRLSPAAARIHAGRIFSYLAVGSNLAKLMANNPSEAVSTPKPQHCRQHQDYRQTYSKKNLRAEALLPSTAQLFGYNLFAGGGTKLSWG
ncbi:MAG: hypothetical protein V4628_05760 [Pseudomonadota bacterium]